MLPKVSRYPKLGTPFHFRLSSLLLTLRYVLARPRTHSSKEALRYDALFRKTYNLPLPCDSQR